MASVTRKRLPESTEQVTTRVESVTAKLRDMIVSGALAIGARVPERDLAEIFGVSRTPVRVALGILEAEGFVRGEPNRGFVVCGFSIEDTLSAFDVRGALEGLAARTAAERGLGDQALASFGECIEEGRTIIADGRFSSEYLERWQRMNDRFHDTLSEAANLPTLEKVREFMLRMPRVVSVRALFTDDERDNAVLRLTHSQFDHERIFDAMRRGQGARAESLVREHAHMAREDLARLLRSGVFPHMRGVNGSNPL